MHFVRRIPEIQPAEAVILLADLAINLGFYMLIPYISVHVRGDLGLTATAAGTVLAVRTLVQQVLMVFAGPTADLYGYKRVLLAGLFVRAIGFASFALMGSLTGLVLSAALSGTGGALFNSAERAAFAAINPGPNQASRFSLLYTANSIGTTLGPLVGALLLNVDFRLLSVASGAVYLPIALLIWLFLPNLDTGRARPAPARAAAEVVTSVAAVARNRVFVAYCLIAAGFWAISGQINISLSLYAAEVTGSQTSVKYLLLANSLIVIALQYPLSRWLQGRIPVLLQWTVGCALMGLAFLPIVPLPAMSGLYACVVLMSFGAMLVRPSDYTIVIGMAPRDSLASYYGFSALSVAVGGSAGQYLGGRLLDVADASGAAWVPWVTFAAIGVGAALAMIRFGRKVHIESPA